MIVYCALELSVVIVHRTTTAVILSLNKAVYNDS